jgi:arylsulfatase A-like enzyme
VIGRSIEAGPGRLRPRALAALVAGLVVCACGGVPATDGPRLVVLFAPCTVDRAHLGPYATDVAYTPALDAFAREGVVFEHCQTEAGQSGTAYASLLSGTQADRHGVYFHPAHLADDVPTIGEAFRDAGWDTWFWHGHPMASPEHGYARGIAHAEPIAGPAGLRFAPGDPTFDGLLDRLAREPGYRALVVVSFSLTHGPYREGREPRAYRQLRRRHPEAAPLDLPELERRLATYDAHRLELQWDFAATAAAIGLDARAARELDQAIQAAYASGMHQLDRLFGLFTGALARRGLADASVVAFVADHGEVFLRESAHFKWTHGVQLAPEVLSVPWLLRAPGVAPGRYPGVVRSIDVFPTLAGLAGVPVPSGVDGVDLAPALRGAAAPPHLVAVSHSTLVNPAMLEQTAGWGAFHALVPRSDPELLWVALRDGDRFARLRSDERGTWAVEVYDLATDAALERDLWDDADPEHARLGAELARARARLVAGCPPHPAAPAGAEPPARLRGLGYARRRGPPTAPGGAAAACAAAGGGRRRARRTGRDRSTAPGACARAPCPRGRRRRRA